MPSIVPAPIIHAGRTGIATAGTEAEPDPGQPQEVNQLWVRGDAPILQENFEQIKAEALARAIVASNRFPISTSITRTSKSDLGSNFLSALVMVCVNILQPGLAAISMPPGNPRFGWWRSHSGLAMYLKCERNFAYDNMGPDLMVAMNTNSSIGSEEYFLAARAYMPKEFLPGRSNPDDKDSPARPVMKGRVKKMRIENLADLRAHVLLPVRRGLFDARAARAEREGDEDVGGVSREGRPQPGRDRAGRFGSIAVLESRRLSVATYNTLVAEGTVWA